MKLDLLLRDTEVKQISSNIKMIDITDICVDSRQVTQGAMFVDLSKGQYRNDAIMNGASIIVSEDEEMSQDELCYDILFVTSIKRFLIEVLRQYFQSPSQSMNIIGITGTNGKTTISYLVESILKKSGRSCGVIGTVSYRLGDECIAATNTTPGIIENQRLLKRMNDANIKDCVMEVSSHALDQGRVDLIDFNIAVFTNLSSDHLDYHKTDKAYFEAKLKLFTGLAQDSIAIVNMDDSYGGKIVDKTEANILSYGIDSQSDIMAYDIGLDENGIRCNISTPKGNIDVCSSLVGYYNIYNILGSVGVCLACGVSIDAIQQGIKSVLCVPGRLENVQCGQDYRVFIDYAHTEDALLNVLKTLRTLCSFRLICVFGCGGDRDPLKRSRMGQVSSQWADFTIITTDNSRTEDPKNIIEDIKKGFKGNNYKVIMDRKEAIYEGISMAKMGDIVLIAGKGHEMYQIVGHKKISFDEKDIIQGAILC